MGNILVLTYESDPHADSICNFFEEHNVEFFRVNTEHIMSQYKITFDSLSHCYFISDADRTVQIDETWNIWNRRVLEPIIPETIPENLHNIILTETKRTWDGLLFSHPSKVVNLPQADHNSNTKIEQLRFAISYRNGIKVPDTILTNDPDILREFYQNHETVCHKLLQVPMVIRNDDYFGVYTNIVLPEHIEQAELIRRNPCLFQEYIEKRYELRITALTNKIIPIAIYSQSSPVSRIDFRRYDFQNVRYEKVEIPQNVETFCFDLLTHYQLNFAEIDMIYTPNNEYYFLEINPKGQWLWLEQQSGYNLTRDVAENLL